MKIIPARKIESTVSRVLKAEGDDFVSQEVDRLELTYGGIKGDYHEGLTRNSGGREPWYKRGTEMHNERQLSILSEEELKEIATGMKLDAVEPGWIGANLVIKDIPNLSYLPPRTILMFDGGVSLRIDGYNAPCRFAGGEIARALGSKAEDVKQTDIACLAPIFCTTNFVFL